MLLNKAASDCLVSSLKVLKNHTHTEKLLQFRVSLQKFYVSASLRGNHLTLVTSKVMLTGDWHQMLYWGWLICVFVLKYVEKSSMVILPNMTRKKFCARDFFKHFAYIDL